MPRSEKPPSSATPTTGKFERPRAWQNVSLMQTAAPKETVSSGPEINRDSKGVLTQLGKYKIIRKMASGAGGDVYEGQDTQMGRRVAVKTITKVRNKLKTLV